MVFNVSPFIISYVITYGVGAVYVRTTQIVLTIDMLGDEDCELGMIDNTSVHVIQRNIKYVKIRDLLK